MTNNNLRLDTSKIPYNHHKFDLAKQNLKEFSTNRIRNFKLEKVEEDGGFLWLGNHSVTGTEFNLRISKIQDMFISVNSMLIELRKEFGVVYTALNSLDEDIITALRVQLNQIEKAYRSIEVTNNKLILANEDIKSIIEKQRKTVEVLAKFKQRLDEYEHLSDVDNIWRDMNVLKNNVTKLENMNAKLNTLKYLHKIDEIWQKLENAISEILEINNLLNIHNERLEKSEQRLNTFEEFIIKIENQKPIHIEIFQYKNKEYKIKKNNSLNDLNLSIFNKNYDDLGENISNYNSIDNNIVAIRYENLSEIENTTYKVDRMLENKYIYKADKTKTYWS